MNKGSLLVLGILALCAGDTCTLSASETEPPASIVRIDLSPEADERQPFALPTEPENTLEVDFPMPVEDWAGRGFTPDPEKFAGDFVIEAARGRTRIFVTPVAAQAHRVLHVVLAGPAGTSRGVSLEFVPAPPGLAWRKVVFQNRVSPTRARSDISLARRPPQTPFRAASPDSEIGLIRTLRLMLNMPGDGARAVAAANPALQLGILDPAPRSFGDYTLANRFAVRDMTTDTLGLCVSVANQTARRLFFDPGGWLIRARERVYPVRTVDFANEVEPGATAAAFLILAGAGGDPFLLTPDNAFEVSAVLTGTANPRPVHRLALEAFEAQ